MNREYERLLGVSPADLRLRLEPFGWHTLWHVASLDDAILLSQGIFGALFGISRNFSVVITLMNKVSSFMHIHVSLLFLAEWAGGVVVVDVTTVWRVG
jgi:hypothetical protein